MSPTEIRSRLRENAMTRPARPRPGDKVARAIDHALLRLGALRFNLGLNYSLSKMPNSVTFTVTAPEGFEFDENDLRYTELSETSPREPALILEGIDELCSRVRFARIVEAAPDPGAWEDA